MMPVPPVPQLPSLPFQVVVAHVVPPPEAVLKPKAC
jgi:hypothetical protein